MEIDVAGIVPTQTELIEKHPVVRFTPLAKVEVAPVTYSLLKPAVPVTVRLPMSDVELALPETIKAELEAVPVVTREVVVADVVVELVTMMPVAEFG